MSLRRLWLLAHRWLALSLGVPLAVVALLGAGLTVAQPLDRWANPRLFDAPTAAPLAPDALASAHAALVREFGPATGITFRPPREPGETLRAVVRGAWSGTVSFDPATGNALGRRGEHEGLYPVLFELHSSLLMEDTGKAMLAVLALAYVVLLVSGLVLWWPARWGGAWRIEWRRGARRAVFDLHRVGGSLLGVLVGVSVLSGAYMAWRPLSGVVTSLSGSQPLRPPTVPAAAPAVRVPLDEMMQRAQALFPDGSVGYVQVAGDRRPVRVRLKLPDDPHPNGLTSVWMHPATGEVLRADRWTDLDPGARAYTVVYPLHTGELGGPVHTVATALAGLVLFGFGATGVWLWWQRRRPRADLSRDGAAPLRRPRPGRVPSARRSRARAPR